jgi:hypothetical protein
MGSITSYSRPSIFLNIICCLIFSYGTLSFSQYCLAEKKLDSMDQLKKSKEYRAYLSNANRIFKERSKDLYSEKWFNPGSFYGQVFIKDDGYLNLYQWLNIDPQKFSLVETEAFYEPEFLRTVRGYLDRKSHFIEMTIIAPHPRSLEAIKLGLVTNYQKLFPGSTDIDEIGDLDLGFDKIGKIATLKNGQSQLVYTTEQGTRILASVEHFRHKESLISFFKSLNLGLFEQRVNS